MLALPAFVILLHPRQQRLGKLGVSLDFVHTPDAIGNSAAIAARLRAGRFEPVARVILGVPSIGEPADFVEVMAGSAADRAITAGPEGAIHEFGVDVAGLGRAVYQVLGDELP